MPPCRASSMIATPTNIDMSALSAQLSPRDETFGADPNTNNILIALGVVLALAFICILVNLGLIRWGDRSLFARLPCCTSRLSIFDEDDDEPILRKAKIRRIPRIHDIALASHPSSPKDDRNLTWKHLMPLSVRYLLPSNHKPSSYQQKHVPSSTPTHSPTTPEFRCCSQPTPVPLHASIRVAVAIAMPNDPNSCNTPCYEIGTADLAAPWKTTELRKKEKSQAIVARRDLDRRMMDAMLLSSTHCEYPNVPSAVSYLTL
ncbi:unnamed protein product [Somion occarium]|uniref:Uncharacterized protein n=1 Tax=Somion occarium TaxID=3059160 RepID=A0ABP1CTI2_9APHY